MQLAPCSGLVTLPLHFNPFAYLHTYRDSVAKLRGNWITNSGRKPRDKNLLTDGVVQHHKLDLCNLLIWQINYKLENKLPLIEVGPTAIA